MAAEQRAGGGRIVFDLTSAARWSGPPVGIVRAQRELAGWAVAHVPGVVFALFDSRTMTFHEVPRAHADAFIAGQASLNLWGFPDSTGARPHRSARVPPLVYDLIQGRRTWLRLWERVRLTTRRAWLARLADRLQRLAIRGRYVPVMLNPDGSRRAFPTADAVMGPELALTASDTLVAAGYGWSQSNIDAIAAAKAAAGFRFSVLCYDIIPLMFPQFFDDRGAADVRRYWDGALAIADVVVVNANAVARDVGRYADEIGVAVARICVVPLGADPAQMTAGGALALPAGLEPERYALFVSTIEPRKGHELLYRVWRRLLAAGVPQAHAFKLVFVGRPGWMMEAFSRTLAADVDVAGSLLVLDRVDDATLDGLYRGAAFCLYPSIYEGFGLPLVEAFARGKAVLASDGGALAEVAAGLSPALPVGDEDAWFETLNRWIEAPEARAPYEAAVRAYRHPTWAEAAARFFEAVGAPIV